MPAKASSSRTYGRSSRRAANVQASRIFAELPQSPVRKQANTRKPKENDEIVESLTDKLSSVQIIEEQPAVRRSPGKSIKPERLSEAPRESISTESLESEPQSHDDQLSQASEPLRRSKEEEHESRHSPDEHLAKESIISVTRPIAQELPTEEPTDEVSDLILSWQDVCPTGDNITKIAEASYAEVYRVTNERGVSIIKVMRLPSPIKPQTKQQN